MKMFSLYLSLMITVQCSAQNWDVSTIPESMKKDAHVVTREEKQVVDIKSISKAYFRNHEVYTILDEKGKSRQRILEYTDPFRSLEDLSVKLYDASGKLIKKYAKKDMQSVYAGEGLITDSKYYYLILQTTTYPITIEYDSEVKYSGSLHYPSYTLQSPEQSLVSGQYVVTVPADLDIRYRMLNSNIQPQITTEGGNKMYKWTAEMMPALKYEELGGSERSRYPMIILAPNKFELDGVEGDMSSWENFGKWYGGLAKSSLNLDEDKKAFFRNLVKDAKTDREKAAIVYNYLQENFRYVSIQLGIGGFKPFPAMTTDKNKYGDCKALSNYTQACLDAVGLKSYQALINAGVNERPLDPTMPYNGFNHVILCLPQAKDSIWLECTSNTNEFGVLGGFTENRNALLITENGGKLVPTPRSKSEENLFSTRCIVKLKEDGTAKAQMQINTSGEYKRLHLTGEKKDDQKSVLINYFGLVEPDFFELKDASRKGEYMLDLEMEKLPTVISGDKMFLSPRMYKIWNRSLPPAANRTLDVYFPHPFLKRDTTVFVLPIGYKPESLPSKKEFSSKHAHFSSEAFFDAGSYELKTVCELELKDYVIPAGEYAEVRSFFDTVFNEFNSKLIVKKN